MHTIVIAEDDCAFRSGLETLLTQEGFTVQTADSGPTVLKLIDRQIPSLVILDVMLPGQDGFEICRVLRGRAPQLPIILMSCRRTDELDRVCGLDGGADDYLVKPFGSRELVARIRARLRRAVPAGTANETCSFGEITVDFQKQLVTRAGKRILLTRMEYNLLVYMMQSRGRVISREELMRNVWGHAIAGRTRTVDTHVLELRKKLELEPNNPVYLRSVRGTGYQLV